MELALPQHHPCTPQIWVEFLACKIVLGLLILLLAGLDCRLALDAVQFYSLLALEYGCFVVAAPYACSTLVGTDVHGQQCRIVIVMTVNLRFHSITECQLTVVHNVVVCGHGMVKARQWSVLFGGTAG